METTNLLQKLIQIPSPSGQEKELAQFILSYCKENNIPAKIQKGNVVIYLIGKNKDKCLIFNAHMDTVRIGSKANWKYPPTEKNAGKIVDGKIYGLGASDDKSAIASMLLLASQISISPCDIWFTFVCNEETDGSGTKEFLKWFTKTKYFSGYKKIAAIVGEPTNLSTIEIGHRGNIFLKLETAGISGHGGKRYALSDSSVRKMLKALNLIQKEFKKWKKTYQDKILGEPSMNITSLHTIGNSINQMPKQCVATLDFRTTISLHKKIINLLQLLLGRDLNINIKGSSSPGLTNSSSVIVKICKKILQYAPLTISLGTTDLSQFIEAGIDTVVLGPGSKDMMHKENEYTKIKNVEKALEIYKNIIHAYAEQKQISSKRYKRILPTTSRIIP